MSSKSTSSEKHLLVRRGRVDSVCLYEVKEDELAVLEDGESTGIHLNFSIFLYSIAISCITTLCTATFQSNLIQNAFLFTSIVGLILGTYLLILWWKGRKSIRAVIKVIKSRLAVEQVEEITSIEHFEEFTDIKKEVPPPKG